MEEIIKSKEVIAYKGMDFNMACKGFHYEIGKSYKTDKAELCNCGFHACLNPRDVLDYYPKYASSRYFKVKLSGEITKCDNIDTKVAATEITILEEITDTFNEVIETTEWWKNENVIDLLYFSDGLAEVQRVNSDWNFINKNGKLISDEWFNYVRDFKDGFAVVRNKDYEYNFIDKHGKILFNEWFIDVGHFNDGFAKVQRGDGLWNFIDKDGKLLSNEWFEWADDFHDGFARVRRSDNLYNFINKQGKFLFNEWFVYVYSFNDGLADVKRINGEQCKIDKTGKLYKD